MKKGIKLKFLGICLVILLGFAVLVWAAGIDRMYKPIITDSPDSQYADTVWMPESDVRLYTVDYTQFGIEFEILTYDTLYSDSIQLDLYTGVEPSALSAKLFYAFGDTIIGDSTRISNKWFYPDSIGTTYWLQKYIWLRVIYWREATTAGETLTVEKDCYSAAGDSMLDWNHTGSGFESEIDEGIGSIDYADYIYVIGPDSVVVMALADDAAGEYIVDSVRVSFVSNCESTTVAACTLAYGIAFGDTSEHHYDSLSTDSLVNTPITTDSTTFTHAWATCPTTGLAWTVSQTDSILVVFSSQHKDTTAGGDGGIIKVYAVDIDVFYDISLNPPLACDIRWIFKE